MKVTTPDLIITTVECLVPGDVFIDPADETRHVADRETKKRYRSDYLVIKEEVPVMTDKVNGSHSEGVQAIRAELAPEQKIEPPPDKGDDKSGE